MEKKTLQILGLMIMMSANNEPSIASPTVCGCPASSNALESSVCTNPTIGPDAGVSCTGIIAQHPVYQPGATNACESVQREWSTCAACGPIENYQYYNVPCPSAYIP